MFERKK